MRRIICGLAIITGTAVSLFADDLTMTSKVTKADGQITTAVSYLSRDHMRMAHGDGMESIMDATSGEMTSIDNRKKTYFVMTPADFEQMAAKMNEQMNSPEMKKMHEQMDKQSPADRKKMEDAMGGMLDVKVLNTGVTRRIAGYSCTVWTMAMGQMSTTEECLSTDLIVPVQMWQAYRKYAEGMKSAMASMGPMASAATKMRQQMKDMKGYPLSTRTTVEIMGHKTVVGSEVTDIKHGSIPASVWQVPAGYARVDNPMLKAFERHSHAH